MWPICSRTAGSGCSSSRHWPAYTASRSGCRATSTAAHRPYSSSRSPCSEWTGTLRPRAARPRSRPRAPYTAHRPRTQGQATTGRRLGLNPGPGVAPGPQANTVRQPYVPSQPLRLHQPPQQGQGGQGHGGQGQGEAPPLPLRAEYPDRPTPAEAIPGIRTADDVPDASHSEPGVVRGTMGLPQLPRRANQEHLVPQLREAPAPRSDDEQALHDPGLMAAFRRGIELAEARSEAEADTAPEPETGLGTAADPQAWQPRAPLEPLPVRGLTATVAPYPSGPAQDAAPVDEPLETNTSKE